MTISPIGETRVQIQGDGTTDRVDIPFQFVDQTDLSVVHTNAAGVNTTWVYQQSPGNFYFTGGNYQTGTVIFNAADLASGERLTVSIDSLYQQAKSLAGEVDPVVIERALDRATLNIHAIADRARRSLSVGSTVQGAVPDYTVPDLPENHGIMRKGDGLVAVLIDSEFITENAQIAQDAANAAAESIFQIRSTFLGEQASDPTTDLNGNPLTGGEWYFNTTSRHNRVYHAATGLWYQSPDPRPNSVDTNTIIDEAVSAAKLKGSDAPAMRAKLGVQLVSGRNDPVINGRFQSAPEGLTTPAQTGTHYFADGNWVKESAGSTVETVVFEGDRTFAFGSDRYARAIVSSVAGASNYAAVQHRIENVDTFNGERVTLVLTGRAGVIQNASVEIVQDFGSGGSADVFTNAGQISLTTNPTQIELIIDIPSTAGKIVGSGNYLAIRIFLDAGSDFNARTGNLGQQNITFDFGEVGLLRGDATGQVRPKPPQAIGDVIQDCQRFLYVPDRVFRPTSPASSGSNTNFRTREIDFPVTMARIPDMEGTSSTLGAVTWPFVGTVGASAQVNPGNDTAIGTIENVKADARFPL